MNLDYTKSWNGKGTDHVPYGKIPPYFQAHWIITRFQDSFITMKKVVSETSGAVFSLPWLVAKDEGFFAEESIDMEFVESHSVHVEQPATDPEKVDPILGHTPFEEKQVAIYRA